MDDPVIVVVAERAVTPRGACENHNTLEPAAATESRKNLDECWEVCRDGGRIVGRPGRHRGHRIGQGSGRGVPAAHSFVSCFEPCLPGGTTSASFSIVTDDSTKFPADSLRPRPVMEDVTQGGSKDRRFAEQAAGRGARAKGSFGRSLLRRPRIGNAN